MFYTIYKTINIKNGKWYIGKHQTNNIHDTYLGSGKTLVEAIKKYGRNNFSKEILYVFSSEEEMNAKEKELITETIVLDRNCYNTAVGGEGGPHFNGRQHTNETKNRIRQSLLGRKRKQLSAEQKQNISKAMIGNKSKTGQTVSEETRLKISKSKTGRKMSEETKRKISETRKRIIAERTR